MTRIHRIHRRKDGAGNIEFMDHTVLLFGDSPEVVERLRDQMIETLGQEIFLNNVKIAQRVGFTRVQFSDGPVIEGALRASLQLP